jgi:hypothetical protein
VNPPLASPCAHTTVVGTPLVTLAPIWSVGAMVAERVKMAQVQGLPDTPVPSHVGHTTEIRAVGVVG